MWNSGNWRSQASRIAWILSFGCFDMGTILSRFSSTKSRTNICKRWSVIYLSYILQVFVCYLWKESQPMCKNWCSSCYLKRNIFIVLFLNRKISETSTTYVFRSVWTTCAQSTFVTWTKLCPYIKGFESLGIEVLSCRHFFIIIIVIVIVLIFTGCFIIISTFTQLGGTLLG